MSPLRSPSMGALYEDVEMFFGAIFAWYGRLISSRPFIFMIPPVLICSFLSVGLMNVKFEYHLYDMYAPLDGQTLHDQHHLEQLFGNANMNQFYSNQLLNSGKFIAIILSHNYGNTSLHDDAGQGNNLHAEEVITWISTNITTKVNNITYGFEDLCARRGNLCYVEMKEVTVSDTSVDSDLLMSHDVDFLILGGIKLKFYLSDHPAVDRWLNNVIQQLEVYAIINTTMVFCASNSLDLLLHGQVCLPLFFYKIYVHHSKTYFGIPHVKLLANIHRKIT